MRYDVVFPSELGNLIHLPVMVAVKRVDMLDDS